MHEPYDWKDMCGPGAARIVLAFTASPEWILTYGDSVAGGTSSYGKTRSPTLTPWSPKADSKAGYPDSPGTAYMMYLATKLVNICSGVASTHVEDCTTSDGVVYHGLTYWLNHLTSSGLKKNTSIPFKFNDVDKTSSSAMDAGIEASIRAGVPAIVGAKMMYLPSQAETTSTINHFVSIVAYDNSTGQGYFYYVDTCWTVEKCGDSGSKLYDPYDKNGALQQSPEDPYLEKNKNGTSFDVNNTTDRLSFNYRSKYPGTWRISKSDLWTAVSKGIGWYGYSGGSVSYGPGL
jgi:hypothetical protein